MMPYSITFLTVWSAFLFLYWQLGLPLGIQGVTNTRLLRRSRSNGLTANPRPAIRLR